MVQAVIFHGPMAWASRAATSTVDASSWAGAFSPSVGPVFARGPDEHPVRASARAIALPVQRRLTGGGGHFHWFLLSVGYVLIVTADSRGALEVGAASAGSRWVNDEGLRDGALGFGLWEDRYISMIAKRQKSNLFAGKEILLHGSVADGSAAVPRVCQWQW